MRRATIGVCLTLGLTQTVSARAQQTEGRFRLGFDGVALAAESGTFEYDTDAGKQKVDYSDVRTGLFGETGIVLGGGGANVFGGARLGLASRTRTLEFDDAAGGSLDIHESSFSILPHLGYAFSPGSRTRFFLSGTLGYQGTSGESTSGDTTDRTESSGFVFGAGVGLFGFLTPRMSIDPAVSLLRFSGKGEAAGLDTTFSGTVFMISVGLSGWLGGADQASEALDQNGAANAAAEGPALDAPESQPEPEPAPVTATRVSDDGVVTRSVHLESGTVVRLVGQPRKDGAHVLLSFSMVDHPPQGMSSWSNCHEGRVLSDDSGYPLDGVGPGPTGFGDTAVVRSRARVGALTRLLKAEQKGTFELCGTELSLGIEERREILDFMRSFKGVADRYKTWDPSLERSGETTTSEPESDVETSEPGAVEPEPPEEPEVAPPVGAGSSP